MAEAEDNRSTPTPQQVLEALQKVSPRCKIRLPQVTPEIEALAHSLNPHVLAGELAKLKLALLAVRGLKQFTEAAAARLHMLPAEIAELSWLDPRRGRLMGDYRTFKRAPAVWQKFAATDFFQSAQLMADDPLDLDPRKDLAIMQTFFFASVAPILERAGIRLGASNTSIACRATAALINDFTCFNTTAVAVGSATRRQFARQAKALSGLAEGIKKDP